MLDRRLFLQTTLAATAALPGIAQDAPNWGGNVIDIHLHFRPGVDTNWTHLQGCGVTHAVLLTRAADEERAKEAKAAHPKHYVRFESADVGKPEGIATLRKAAAGGAIGFGEIKLHLAVDSAEMRRLYDLAAELHLPVLIHFADVPQFEGEGTFTSPFNRLPAMVKAHPKTTFMAMGFGPTLALISPMTLRIPRERSNRVAYRTGCFLIIQTCTAICRPIQGVMPWTGIRSSCGSS